jgi:hypothetical protein
MVRDFTPDVALPGVQSLSWYWSQGGEGSQHTVQKTFDTPVMDTREPPANPSCAGNCECAPRNSVAVPRVAVLII